MEENTPAGPLGGVVWLSGIVLTEFWIGVRPFVGSALKQLDDIGQRRSKVVFKSTHATPATWPPFSAQSMVPFWLNTTDIGNSPPLLTGGPTICTWDGQSGLMEKREMVSDPACQ